MRLRDLLDLLFLAALFGGSFLFMRIAAPAFGPYAMAALRVGIAALILLPIAAMRGGLGEIATNWRPLFVAGLVNAALPFLCYAIAALTLPSGVSALLNSTTPLWGAVVAWVWLREQLTRWAVLGLAIGFAGALILFWTPLPTPTDGRTVLAFLSALSAPLCYGIAASYAKRRLAHTSTVANATGSLTAAALVLAVPAWLTWPQAPVALEAWVAVVLLASVSTACAYLLFYKLISRIGPVRAVSVTYLVPLFGITWGALLLGERVTSNMLLAGAVILLGTALVTGVIGPRRAAQRDP